MVKGGEQPLIIGGYRLLKIIGQGGAGRVYEARDEALGRHVAIKLMHPQLARDETNRERFTREARAMATVRTPHVAAVFSIGEERGLPYIVMEFIEGENLEERLKRETRLRIEEALVYARDCALALQAADNKGIVHRDVKPANIVVKDGRAVLTDFGLARPMDGSANMTVEGQIAGTATFMSPDRITGQGDDRRADMYSLGATLYCLIAGKPPFERKSPMDVIAAHINEEPQPLTEAAPGTSPRVGDLVKRMMAKNPQRRHQTYDDLIEDINHLIDGGGQVDGGLVDEPTEVHGVETGEIEPINSREAAVAAANDPFGAPGDLLDDDPFASGPAEVGNAVGMPTGVMGTLKQMGVVDICHMLEMGKKDAVIDLNSTDGLEGKLCFQGGQVSYCTWGNLKAEEAFYDLCRRKEGFFRIHYGRRQEETNIEGNNQFLLLEAMRRLDDESRAMPAAPSAEGPPVVEPAKRGPTDFGPPAFEPSPDVTVPSGDPVMSEDGPELPHTPPPPFGPPPHTGGAAKGLPAPPPPPGAPAPIRAGAPVGIRETTPPPKRPAPPRKERSKPAARKPAPSPPKTPAPVPSAAPPKTPATPAPVDVPTVPAPALVAQPADPGASSDDVAAQPDGVDAQDSGGRGDTLIWDSEQEQAMREAVGKPAPQKPLGEVLSETWNEQVLPSLVAVNENVAVALEKNDATRPLADTVRKTPWLLPAAIAGLFVTSMLAVLLIVALAGGEEGADASLVARIDAGEAAAVLSELDAVPAQKRSARDELARGHALAKMDRTSDALVAYQTAQALGLTDRRAMNVALGRLGEPQPTPAINYLVALNDERVTGELLALSQSPSWQRRHNAVYVLDERGEKGTLDAEGVAILDVLTGPTCKDRRQGLLDLRRVGRTEKAREAFTKALALKDTDNACMKRELEQMAGD